MSKRLLNSLYLTTQESYIHKKGETVVIDVPERPSTRFPLIALGSIVCFGNIRFSPFLLGACAENNVFVSFLTENGRFLASVQGATHGNVLVRREQYRRADDSKACLHFSRNLVAAKIQNSRTVLDRASRDAAQTSPALEEASSRMAFRLRELRDADSLESVRGIEGKAAATYFGVFDNLILTNRDAFCFDGRNRRPPLDRVNALLSFLYTLIDHDLRGALEAHGVDPQAGLFHQDRPGRFSLSQDMLEEFRAPLGDRLALSLINRSQIRSHNFDGGDGQPCYLNEEGRKTVLVAYQKRKQDQIRHPFLNEKMPIGLLFHAQALLFSRWLRGDFDAYMPFLWR